jgi:putative hemolysin
MVYVKDDDGYGRASCGGFEMRESGGMRVLSGYAFSIMVVLLLVDSALAMFNPNMVNCERMGYEYTIEKTAAGETGYCIMPDGTKCLAADFASGTCGAEYSYCAKKGYEMKTGEGEAVCVRPDGTEEYVTVLVKEDEDLGPFVEEELISPCGDGICFENEDAESCPEDCLLLVALTSTSSSSTSMSSSSSITSTTGVLRPTTTTLRPVPPARRPWWLVFVGVLLILVVIYLLTRTKSR